ncbi:MAG TPA: glycosyltransferase [Candidatus Kapabacteria bacterium]|nr:glycosyltransferase [Candidatus Kapabacteria bacterium]
MHIPKIIHQTWKTSEVPPQLAHDFFSWQKHHPEWTFIGWDDASLAMFVETEFPQYLDLYRSYKHQIERVHMARYLILKKQGGVFVDLDMECLKPIEPLLADWTLVVGFEPFSHAEHPASTRRGMSKIVGTGFITSVPEHPFWEHLLEQLPLSRHHYDPLETTGPIFLTAAIVAWPVKDQIAFAEPALLYPFDRAQTWSGETFDIEFWEPSTRRAFAIHHWQGSWLPRGSKNTRNVAQIKGRLLTEKFSGAPPNPLPNKGSFPLISCLMVTRNRFEFTKTAIHCFQNQTYPMKELVIVEHAPKNELLAEYVRGLDDPRISYYRVPNAKTSLGDVRNYSIECAKGHFVAIWDDDDLFDPLRLELQYLVIREAKAHACVLSRYTEWWPASRKLSISEERAWEPTLLCEKSVLPPYSALPLGGDGDTQVIEQLLREARVAYIDIPRLYLYIFHGGNAWGDRFALLHWQRAVSRFTGAIYERVVTELSKRLPMPAYARRFTSPITASTVESIAPVTALPEEISA